MNIDEFLHKHVLIELKDGTNVEGIIIDIHHIDNYEDSIFYTTLNIRVDYNDYRLIYINEVDTIGEVK